MNRILVANLYVDEPQRKRRRCPHHARPPRVFSNSVIDLLDFFKCFPGVKRGIGSRLLRYYNPATARPIRSEGSNRSVRSAQMMELLSPCAATTTLMQLNKDMQSLKLSFAEKNGGGTDDRDTHATGDDYKDDVVIASEHMQEC